MDSELEKARLFEVIIDVRRQLDDILQLIDTHAHLDELEDLEASLQRAKRAGVSAIIAVGMDYESNLKTMRIAQRHSGFIYPALGMHPQQLNTADTAQVDRVVRQIEDNMSAIVAIGEVGLDYHKRVRADADKGQQKEVFGRLLELAAIHDKPVVVHSRYAWKDALDLVREAKVKQAVFHWYTGFSSVLREIITAGYYISATPAAEYHREHRRAIREAPLTHLLLETDCPVQYGRDTRFTSEPADIMRTLRAAIDLKGLDAQSVALTTTTNATTLFKLGELE